MTRIVGIVNVTTDSFSDGGRYLEPADALAHARELMKGGADVIELGAESTHPDSGDVSDDLQIERLALLISTLVADGATISVDTRAPAVMRFAIRQGAQIINDVSGLRSGEAVAVLRDCSARVVVMYSASRSGRPSRTAGDPNTIVQEVQAFFEERIAALTKAGIARERIILDPGMGMFLGTDPEVSCQVLRRLPELRALGVPLMVSVSRKSFLGALAGGDSGPRPASERGPATLAAELWASTRGADYIRTHNVRALRDALRVQAALGGTAP